MTYGIDLSGAGWRKSTRSQQSGNCIEVAAVSGGRIAVRDSKNPDGPALVVNAAEWAAFVSRIKAGALGR
ncbi:MAG: DUF397 domain-containing protein [Actinomycetes bacterium]|jgi:hypothetical protein|nr:MAG: DUF397 domain-containing protein [Actinomycetota bacterium]